MALAQSAGPRINFIEPHDTNQVLIHFDTEANRTYVLQYVTNLLSTNWSNLYTGFNYPFPNHYIIADTRTDAMRLYRLRITTP